ncbi:hypothetical protein JCM6882_001449 [Rhodosporidiobolus microsporus]
MADSISVHAPAPQLPGPSPPVASTSSLSPGTVNGFTSSQPPPAAPNGTAGGSADGADGPPKPKKPRLPRIAEACIRCKSRKQRCIRDGPGVCKNCAAAKITECIIAPRVKRRSTKKVQPGDAAAPQPAQAQPPSTTAYVSAPSPSSLQSLLRESAPHPPPINRQPYPPPNAMYPYPPHHYGTSPPFPAHPLPMFPSANPLATHRQAFPSPLPPPINHPSFQPPQPPLSSQGSPHLGSPTLNLSAPVSDIRSHTAAGGPFGHSASVSPASIPGATPTSQTSPHARPDGLIGPSPAAHHPTNGSSGTVDATPLPIKGDGDAMEYDEEEDEEDAEEEDSGDWHDKAARAVAFLSLSANGNPTYIGPSSGFSWSRFVLAGISGAAAAHGGRYSHQSSGLDPEPLRHIGVSQNPLPDNALENIPNDVADLILSQVYRHVQPRYPFLDWLYLHEIWAHRTVVTQRATQPGASKVLKTASFFIWMVFAIGSRFCQKLAIPNLASPEGYWAKAMEHLEVIVGLHDLKNVQALMLMVMFSFRSSEAPGIWFLVGIIMRVCMSLGLHRRVPPAQAKRMSPYILQLRKRIFWSAYTLDRMMAMSMGRPAGISDHDIDIELPLDYDCVSPTFDLDNPPTTTTSMTSSIQFIKLMRIESMIQKQAYRVDQPRDTRPEQILRLIDEWEAEIPAIAADANCWNVPCCSRDWFLTRSADARMYLLRPWTADPATAEPGLVRLIAKYAAEACEIQKRIHQNPTSNSSLDSLRTVFLSGLTLLHAMQVDRNALPLGIFQRATRANSNTLFSYAGQYRGAAAYGEVFDELASAVLDRLTSPEEPKSAPPPSLQPAVATPLFQSLWEDIPSVMTDDATESFNALLESLGVSTESLIPATGAYSTAVNGTVNGNLDLSEIGAFAPTSGLDFEPFALGSSAGGLW